MKNAILLHGTDGTPKLYWLPYIKAFLEKQGYTVWVPQLPSASTGNRAQQLPFVLENGVFTKNTLIVAHSAGCALALSVLEKIGVKIARAVLVAGWARHLHAGDNVRMPTKYNWKKIRAHVNDIYFINSDDDPWNCDEKEGRYMFDHLGGTRIVLHGQGHMGSDAFKQPYKKFPFLKKLLLDP